MKKNISFLGFFLIIMLVFPFIISNDNVCVNAQENYNLDFINNKPEQKIEYSIGNGKLIYEPIDENSSIITLENLVLFSENRTEYWTNYTYTALAATGNVKLILKGENIIYLNESYFSTGLLFYDSNVTVEGDGSLYIGFENPEKININAIPIEVMGNYDVLNNIKDGNFTDTGNFVLKSGSVTLNALQTIGMGALTVHNDITIEGGVLSTSGQANGLYSVYNNIFLNNGSIQCLEYSITGIFARRGDINIAGENTIIVLKGKENRDTVGLSAGDMSHYDSTFFEAGSIKIKEASLSITSNFIGIFAQCLDDVLNSGNIEIESGNIEIKTVGNNSIIAGMFSQSEEAQNAGSVTVNGGQINIEVENTNALSSDYYSIGIYSDKDVILQSGNVTVKATGAENINSYGIYCEKILKFNGGNHLIIANTSVVTCEPVVSELILINASFSVNGENKVQYESDKIFDYKYIEFNQVTENKLTLIVDNNFAEVGKSVQFSVSIDGKNIEQNKFSWEVLGATSLSTTIDENGYLTIGEDEKASSVTVVATSIDNSSVSKSFIVKINSNNNNNSLMWILFTVLGIFLIIVFVIIGFIINKRNSKIEKI